MLVNPWLNMCRIAAYQGRPISLDEFMCRPTHSLYRQSWAPEQMQTATVNADGYGVAWLAADERPAVYRNIMPTWADPNLPHLARSLHSRVWLGNVRSATQGLGTHILNTQPYIDSKILFTHNGFIDDFAVSARRRIREQLSDEVEAGIEGNTDSEYLFALLRQQQTSAPEALRGLCHWLQQWLQTTDIRALLNFIVSDGESLLAVRSAANGDCPSMYYHESHPGMHNGQVIASEAFDEDPGWKKIPEHHLLQLIPGETATLHRL